MRRNVSGHKRWISAGCIAITSLLLSQATPVLGKSEDKASSLGKFGRFGKDVPGLPERGKMAFIVGQDSITLSEFKSEVLDADPSFPQPDGITLYTNLINGVFLAGLGADPFDEAGNLLPGFNLETNDAYDFGAGFFNFNDTLNQYPDASVSIGLFVTDSFAGCTNQPLRAISAIENEPLGDDITPELVSAYATAIDVMVETLKGWDRDVYLRIGYEFDASFNCHGTDLYIDAFQYIAQRIDALDADKVATVWQAAGYPRDELLENPEFNFIVTDPDHYDTWYPGDEYVDYVGLSTFYGDSYNLVQWGCDELNPEFFSESIVPRQLHDRILDFAREHRKPVMVAEASPQGYEIDQLTSSCIFSRTEEQMLAMDSETLWDLWYEDWFDYLFANRDIIKVAAYINADWDTIPTFSCAPGSSGGAPDCGSGVWGNARIQDSHVILDRFKTRLSRPIFQ